MSDRKRLLPIVLAAALAALTGCASMAPALPEARPDIPASWPLPESGSSTSAGDGVQLPVADIGWRDFFADARLAEVIALALEHNRDLRVAALNVERVQAQYRIQRSQRLPSLGAELVLERRGGDAPVTEVYQAGVGVAAFELDLFGRVRSLGQAALERYLASDEARRATQISLVAQVAGTWLALAADQELLRLSEAVLDAYTQTLELGERRYEVGATSALELEQIRTQVATARADAARQRGQVAQGRHALDLLVGVPVPASLLPDDRVEAVTTSPVRNRQRRQLRGHGFGAGRLDCNCCCAVPTCSPRIPVARRQCRYRRCQAAFFLDQPDRHGRLDQRGVLRPVRQRHPLLGLHPAPGHPHLPGWPPARRAGHGPGRPRHRPGAIRTGHPGRFPRCRRCPGCRPVTGRTAAGAPGPVAAASRRAWPGPATMPAGQLPVLLDVQRTLYAALGPVTRMAEQANRVTLYRALGGGWREESAATPVPATDPQGS